MNGRARPFLIALCLSSACATVDRPILDGSAAADSTLEPAPAAAPAGAQRIRDVPPPLRGRPVWAPGQTLLQGFLGIGYFDDVTLERAGQSPVDIDEDELDLPLVGGGGQLKLAGRRIDFGLEGLISLGWRSDIAALAAGGGGAVVVFDVNFLLVEVYGGPFLSAFLGDRLRVYAGAGPLVEWVDFNEQDDLGDDLDSSGFGVGGYARTGIEFLLPSRMLVGFGARYSEATVDLGDGLGDLDVDGVQLFASFTTGI